MPMVQVELSDELYTRYEAAVRRLRRVVGPMTAQELAMPLMREIAALVYLAEVTEGGASPKDWSFAPSAAQSPEQAAARVVAQVRDETQRRMASILEEAKPATAEEVLARKPVLVWPA